MHLGLREEEYWDCTVHSYNCMVRSWVKVEEQRMKVTRAQAWLTAVCSRATRIPSYRVVVNGTDAVEYTEEQLQEAREYHQSIVSRNGEQRQIR